MFAYQHPFLVLETENRSTLHTGVQRFFLQCCLSFSLCVESRHFSVIIFDALKIKSLQVGNTKASIL